MTGNPIWIPNPNDPVAVEARNTLRRPQRARGQRRVEDLLDATEVVLIEFMQDDISLALIAEKAEVPLPSVYHFFPNRNVALVALAQRFSQQILQMAMTEGDSVPRRWQDVFAFRLSRTAAFLNSEPAALRLFMGAGVSVEVRNVDVAGNVAIAKRRAEYLRDVFDMPTMPDLENRIAISLAITDGIWALSYSFHRRITDEYFEEAVRAVTTYLRCYLPEHLAPRRGAPEHRNN